MGCLGQATVVDKNIQSSHSYEEKEGQAQTEKEKVNSIPGKEQDASISKKKEIPRPISPAPSRGNERASSNEEEPLIPVFRNKPDLIDNNNIQEVKKGEGEGEEGKEPNWNDNNPIACLTIKPTIFTKDNPTNVGKSRLIDVNTIKTLNESAVNADGENDVEIFGKLKTINEDDDENTFLVKSSKTIVEYAFKQVDIKDKSSEEVDQMLEQIENIKKLNHPNISRVYNYDISEDTKYIEIFSEFTEGGELQSKIEEYKADNKHFEEKHLIDWLYQICFALEYLQSQNILHRNIKPSSIFLMKMGFVKLGDFGLNKTETNNSKLKRVKTIMPKIHCAAPEVLEKKEYNLKTEIWYLGVTFFELMNFKFPFEGSNDEEIIDNILEDKKIECSSSYSNDLKDLVNKMISKEPGERPTATDILAMQFIRKRIQNYLNENGDFVVPKDTDGLFDDLEEIESVSDLNEAIEEGKTDVKEEEKKDNNKNGKEDMKEDKKEDEKKEEDKKEEFKKEEKKEEEVLEEQKDKEKKEEFKKGQEKKEEEKKGEDKKVEDKKVEDKKVEVKKEEEKKQKSKFKKAKTRKKVVKINDDVQFIDFNAEKDKKYKNREEKRAKIDLMRQMTNMRDLIKREKI